MFLSFRYAPHNLLSNLVPRASRVLDVGSGEGALALELSKRGCEVSCIERDPALASEAKRRGLDVHTLDVAEDALGALGSFDVIICADVLEHLRDPAPVLGKLRALLRPGGALLVSIPNVAFLSVRLGLLLGRFNYQAEGLLDSTHLRFFTRATSRRLLEDAGFTIDSESMTLPIPAGSLPSLAPQFKWLMERPRLGGALYNALSLVPGLFAYQFIYAAKAVEAPSGPSAAGAQRRS